MDATSDTLNLLEEHAKNCMMQSRILKEKIILPNMLIYNPEAGSLVSSAQCELTELEEAFKQLQKLAEERHAYLSTVKVSCLL